MKLVPPRTRMRSARGGGAGTGTADAGRRPKPSAPPAAADTRRKSRRVVGIAASRQVGKRAAHPVPDAAR